MLRRERETERDQIRVINVKTMLTATKQPYPNTEDNIGQTVRYVIMWIIPGKHYFESNLTVIFMKSLSHCRQVVSSCHNDTTYIHIDTQVKGKGCHPHCSVGLVLISTKHSFPWHAEFWAEPQHLPVGAEFLCFRGILRNSVLARGQIRTMAHFGHFQHSGGHTVCICDFAVIYTPADGAVMEGMLKLLIWAYLKYSKFIW